ncbi:MAG: hypothetical protein M1827_002712 [Pycnora praestabilis]|nr:MAG: hypothetical protein M1827_002712 [Pycnora praestabilis]
MKSLHIFSFVFVFLSAIVLSSPNANDHDDDDNDGRRQRWGCLSDQDANRIVKRWYSIFEGQVELVNRTVTDDFTFEDETINFFFPQYFPPTGPYVTSRTSFIQTLQPTGPPGVENITFTVIAMVHDCNTISFRWQYNGIDTGLDPTSTAKAGDLVTYKGIDYLEIQTSTRLIQLGYSSSDWLREIYFAGSKICFQRDAPEPVCDS